MPIKSVHITNYYHKNSGGISTSYNNLLDAANRRERYVRLIVPGEKEEIEEVGEFGKIYYIPAKYSPVIDKRYRVMMPWQYLPSDSIIRRILIAEMPDMVEVTDKYTLSIIGAMIRVNKFQELGRPMLVHFSCERMDDSIGSFLSNGSVGKWFARRVMGNYNFPNYDFHIANSAYTAEEFYESVKKSANPRRLDWFFNFCWRAFKAPRIPLEERIAVCPRGVNVEQFSPARKSAEVRNKMREQAQIPNNAVVLFYAGRISPEKNIELLPDLMAILAADTTRDYRLLVAGAGPQADWLTEQTAARFPNKIVQIGHLDKDQLADYYANADVFVHPNPREPFGIAPLEAMASGTPTLVPNAGGLLSYATDENSWLAEPTAENFAAGVRDILTDEKRRERKIARAFETSRNFSWENSTDRLFATYDRLYADFRQRNEFFPDEAASKDFNYTELLDYK